MATQETTFVTCCDMTSLKWKCFERPKSISFTQLTYGGEIQQQEKPSCFRRPRHECASSRDEWRHKRKGTREEGTSDRK